jgi:hypothetical protein
VFYAFFRDHQFDNRDVKIENSTNPFEPFEGMTIRNIELVQVDVFGSMIEDTIDYSQLKKKRLTINALHVNTAGRVIRKNIIFKTGDKLNPYVLSQNAKLLRDLSFLRDARIQVRIVDDNIVDVYVVTQDHFPWDVIPVYLQPEKWRFRLRNNNVGGLGGEFNNTYLFDTERKNKLEMTNMSLRYNNIGGSFINSDLAYEFGSDYTTYYAKFNRPFIPYKVNWGGGLTYSLNSQNRTVRENDGTRVYAKFRQNYYDLWLGRQMGVPTQKALGHSAPVWLIPSARYSRIDYIDRPDVKLPEFSLRSYHLFLASVGISSQKYLRLRYVNEYGRVEDVQKGFMAKATGGYQIVEGKDRAYAGLKLGYRNKDSKNGLYYFMVEAGSFIHLKRYTQAALHLKASYMFPLLDLGRQKIRPIFWVDYTLGLNREEGERVFLENPDATNRVILSDLYGTQKLLAHAESNVFTSIDFYGFRVSTFTAVEFGFIDNSEHLFQTPLIGAFSLGLRVKNDFLIFNTIQFRFTFYSNNLSDYINTSFDVNEMNRLRFDNFSIGKPFVIGY